MNVGELVALIAKESAIPEKRVALYARRLREADLLPQSKGRFYPEVSFEHCARLLVALLAAGNPQHAVSTVQDYESLIGIVTDYLMSDDSDRLTRIGVERNTGAAFYVRGRERESPLDDDLFDDEAQRELPADPKHLMRIFEEYHSGKSERDLTQTMRELGHGRFRLVAEFDKIFLGQIYFAFGQQRLEMRYPDLVEKAKARKKEN